MASIPVVTQRSVLPSAQSLPVTDPKGSRAGIILGNAFTQAGQGLQADVAKIKAQFEKIQAEDDAREFNKLDIEYSAFLRELTYGDGTAENPGYLNSLGENAINGYKTTEEAINKKRQELLKTASNRNVADRFNTISSERTNSTLAQFQNHVGDQRKVANDSVTKARIADARANATTDYTKIEEAIVVTTTELTNWGLNNGVPGEAVLSEIRKENSATIEQAILATLVGSTQLARGLVNKYENEMDGLTLASVRDKIENQERQNMTDYERNQRLADKAQDDIWDKNLTRTIVGIQRGTITDENILANQLDSGTSDYKRFFIAQNYLAEVKRGLISGGDANIALDYQLGMVIGTKRDYSFMTDPRIDATQKGNLLTQLEQVLNTDPILSRADIEVGNEIVIRGMVGSEAAFEFLSGDDKAKAAAAMSEYTTRSLAEHKELPDILFQQNLAREVLAKYSDKLILQLPPSTWPPGVEWGGPDTALGLREAYIRLTQKLERKEIGEDQFDREFALLERYQRMLNSSSTINNIELEGQE